MEPCPRIERVQERLFEGEESVLHPIERIVGPLGLRVDQASPWVDARLPGGSKRQPPIQAGDTGHSAGGGRVG
jgi:Flp pilus assembly CpaF family ATPase